jgi:glutamyl-tRNA synthetase
VPDGETLTFHDGHFGEQHAVAGVDFGDFLIWRKDDLPSYQLACVVDDARMEISEVVRGADLITSTFRQLLLYRAFGWSPPVFYHCPLVLDETGQRLAKRDATTTLRGLREAGVSAGALV